VIKLIRSNSAQFATDDTESGPRGLTRAIEKNRGLTPRRAKTGRNPRVKKRVAYDKAKRKVASQRAVFKGGQATLGGAYAGEKTGISIKAKSRKF
jgi:U3 small nucleolar RNA-associated protein 3